MHKREYSSMSILASVAERVLGRYTNGGKVCLKLAA